MDALHDSELLRDEVLHQLARYKRLYCSIFHGALAASAWWRCCRARRSSSKLKKDEKGMSKQGHQVGGAVITAVDEYDVPVANID